MIVGALLVIRSWVPKYLVTSGRTEERKEVEDE